MPAKEQKQPTITITSVRNLRKSIKISWTQGSDNYEVNCHDNPLPSFYKALENLKTHVCTLCELPVKSVDTLDASGITCREHGDNTVAQITARKTIKKGKRVFPFATPLIPMYEDRENKSADYMEKEQATAIEKVISEAKKYVSGERAQGQIVFEEPAKESAASTDNTTPFPEMEEPGKS